MNTRPYDTNINILQCSALAIKIEIDSLQFHVYFLLLARDKVLGGHGPCFLPLIYNKHIPDTLQAPV